MKFNLAFAMASLSVLAQAGPAAVPEANPIASPEDSLFKRDNYCWIVDGPINCHGGTSPRYPVVRQITNDDGFIVTCKAFDGDFIGTGLWDWIPKWDCWVSANYTKGYPTCESGVAWCH